MTEQAKADVEESRDAIVDIQRQVADLQKRREEVIAEIQEKWGQLVSTSTEVTVVPKKSDIFVTLFGVAWMPNYIIRADADTIELPAFGAE